MWSVLDVVDKVEKNIEVQHTESTQTRRDHPRDTDIFYNKTFDKS